MGYGKMEKWIIDKMCLDRIGWKTINKKSFRNQHSTIPTFHYSISEAIDHASINCFRYSLIAG
jgi:hypothetical protein